MSPGVCVRVRASFAVVSCICVNVRAFLRVPVRLCFCVCARLRMQCCAFEQAKAVGASGRGRD